MPQIGVPAMVNTRAIACYCFFDVVEESRAKTFYMGARIDTFPRAGIDARKYF
jgi:hypothetical protein